MTTHEAAGGLERGDTGQVSFLDRIRLAVEMLAFRASAIDAVAGDSGAFVPGVAIVALAGVARSADYGLFVPAYVGNAIVMVVWSLILAAMVHLVATQVFAARRRFLPLYRVVSHTYLLLWIVGIPVVERFFIPLLAVWQLAVIAYATERIYRLDRTRAVAAVLLSALIGLLALAMLSGFVALGALVSWLL